ncbi:hypothetical protein B0H11DRAFT_2285331 [Mycena galericulata]|nr:hypothetical protein B0H11DRAFT_2285331 [Mycena galericulata]
MSSPDIESSTPTSPAFIPTFPLVDSPHADIILRSSDCVDFHVQRGILALVSPFFHAMFTLPQPESSSEIPRIEMQEDAALLDRALRFFYPGGQPVVVATLEELRTVMEVLISKYDVQCIVPVIKQHLEQYMATQPLVIYAVALTHQWKDVAMAAAKHALALPLRAQLDTEAPPELRHITGAAYHNLLRYHQRCGAAARGVVQNLSWVVTSSTYWFCCKNCTNHAKWTFSDGSSHFLPTWFQGYVTNIAKVLEVRPGARLCQDNFVFYEALSKAHCNCDNWILMIDFVSGELTKKIESEIDKVELDFV